MSKYKLWTNVQNNHVAIAFMAVLKKQNQQWVWTDNSADASLWCICGDEADVNRVTAYYEILSNKPSVAYLSNQFTSMPYAEWAYFPISLNEKILHKWLTVKDLGTHEEQWHHDAFKLNHWPNVSRYVGGFEIMMVCSRLLNGWCSYQELLKYNIESAMLDVILADAKSEGNLVFQPKKSPQSNEASKNTLFKRLFNRFSVKSFKTAETT